MSKDVITFICAFMAAAIDRHPLQILRVLTTMSSINHDSPSAPLAAYVAKLERRLQLPHEDREALMSLPAEVRRFDPLAAIVEEGRKADRSIFLLDGLISRQRRIDRVGQIVSISVPGDAVDLQTLYFATTDHALITHVPTVIAAVPHYAIIELCARRPLLAKTLWHDTLVDSAIFREWAINIGHRRAPHRIGYLLLEMEARLAAIGKAADGLFQVFLTQQELASALGLSLVHMNKSLRRLREMKLIATSGRDIRILDRNRLKDLVGFDGAYLHLTVAPTLEKLPP